MPPSRFHVPPRPVVASQSVNGGPPEASIFLSLHTAKNPMNRLSGDQKGKAAPSVPARGWGCNESSGRTHKSSFPSGVVATYAKRRPSGDRANPEAVPPRTKLEFAIGLM